jgi:hypothetical protein
MRYMSWSYEQLMVCPVDYLEVIAEEARRDNAARSANQRGR